MNQNFYGGNDPHNQHYQPQYPPQNQFFYPPPMNSPQIDEKTKKYLDEKSKIKRTVSFLGMAMLVMLLIGAIMEVLISLDVRYFGFLYSIIDNFTTANVVNFVIQMIFTSVSMGGAFLIGAIAMKASVKQLLPFKKVPMSTVAALLTFGVAVAQVSNNIASRFSIIFENMGFSTDYGDVGADNALEIVLMVITVGVLPAFFEEILFRGLVLNRLQKVTSDTFAIFFSALMFGLIHGNVVQIPFAFLLGLYLGWMTVYTKSIIPAMLFHCLNNSISVVHSVLYSHFAEYETYLNIGVCVFFAVMLIVGIFLMARLSRKDGKIFELKRKVSTIPSKEICSIALGNPAIIMLMIYVGFDTILMLIG